MATRHACAGFLFAFCSAVALAAPAEPCGPKDDFFQRSDATLAPVRPMDCSTVRQTPPDFTWPPQDGRRVYELSLAFPDGHRETRRTQTNWVLWNRALPPGDYAWQVKVVGSEDLVSEPRRFTIAADAVSFVVPPGDALVRRAQETPRPRTWSRDPTQPLAAARAERSAGLRRLREEVDSKLATPVQAEPLAPSTGNNYDATVQEHKRTVASALAWAVTRNPRYGDDAARRMLAQARWSTTGPIAYKQNDMANRTVALTLALAYDWTHDYLLPAQKAAILSAIKARTQPMFDDVTARLNSHPYDSHGNLTLGVVAAIGVLTVGDIPEAERWVREALPLAVLWTSPWGWHDGGFGNGSAQLFWDVSSHLPVWYVLRNAAGVDLARKEWVRNLARFMAYFTPPGAPAGVFGDGHELAMPELWGRVAKATARFAPDPLALWYASSFDREDGARIELMLAPRVEEKDARLPPETQNSAFFPSIGWVAMHSRLEDPQRTSVYFKSSPYGSYNHSHGDQNAFVIHHRGERLAIASGYYDGYQTPHWREWYKQTRAANAITFDGGRGQGFNGKEFAGRIVRFEPGEDYDVAVGRAEQAYGSELTRAQRSIVYLRPGVVLVHDVLASAQPRTWEWNLHALSRMEKLGERMVQVRQGAAKMCVEMLSGPEAAFHQTDRFTAPPSGKQQASQWHGTFATVKATPEAEFLVLLRVGAECGQRTAATPTSEGLRVDMDGKTMVFAADGPRVAPSGRPAPRYTSSPPPRPAS